MNKIPFLIPSLFLIFGMAFIPESTPLIAGYIGMVFCFMVLLITFLKQKRYLSNFFWVFPLFTALFFAATGFSRHKIAIDLYKPIEPAKGIFEATIIDYPKEGFGIKSYPAILKGVDRKIVVKYKSNSTITFVPGSKLKLKGNLQPFKKPYTLLEFDYARYMQNQHFVGELWCNENEIIPNGAETNLFVVMAQIRHYVKNAYINAGLNDQNRAVLMALTTGDKNELSPEEKQAFSNAGLVHILAVSGLHVGIIFMMLSQVFKYIPGRTLQQLLIIGCLFGFAMFTGLSPSVNRAVVMFSLFSICRLIKRNPNPFNTISVSAFLVLMFDPCAVSMPGFYLSYAAVASIFLASDAIKDFGHDKNSILKYLKSTALVSTSAQIGTIPFTLYWFGQFPVYFIFANILALPVVGYICGGGIAIALFQLLHIPNGWMGLLTGWLLTYMRSVAAFFASLPGSTFNNIYIYQWEFPILILSVFFLLRMVYLKRLAHVTPALICLNLLVVTHTAYSFWFSKQQYEVKTDNYKVIVTGLKSDIYIKQDYLKNEDRLISGIIKVYGSKQIYIHKLE